MNLLLCVLTYLIAHISCDTCDNLGEFLVEVEQTVGNELTSRALGGHPFSTREDDSLVNCNRKDTCCNSNSEAVLRLAAVDLFNTMSFTMMLTQLEDDVKAVREEVANDIFKVSQAADGEFAADTSRGYVLQNDVNIDDIVRHRLVNFLEIAYGLTWPTMCLDLFPATRELVYERVYVLLTKYKQVMAGLLEGINLVPALKIVAATSLSESCKTSLNRASVFGDVGCKMCADDTTQLKTCYHLCTNVAKGCMRPLLCYIDQWDIWIKRQDEMTRELIAISALRSEFVDSLIKSFDKEYDELLMDDQLDYDICPPISEGKNSNRLNAYKKKSVHLPTLLLDLHEDKFGNTLKKLPSTFCSVSSGVSDIEEGVDTQCWNGTHKGAYIHSSTQFDLEDQKCNPEVIADELPCDTRDMTCDWYMATEAPTSDQPGPATEIGKAVGNNKNSAQNKFSGFIIILVLIFSLVM